MTREQLNDPMWRIQNLYKIVNKDGELVQFKPNIAQQALLKELKRLNLILKARQLGFSTLIQLLMLDQCIFVSNINAGVIAQDDQAASKIFADKIKVAWDNMPAWVHANVKTVGDSVRELSFTNGSCIRVSTSMRSATLQYLHVSEFGKICAKYPLKAKEVMTGSIPTLGDKGFCFIESTAEGRSGKFFELCEAAQKLKASGVKLGPKDYKFFFFAWHDNPEYAQEHAEHESPEDAQYFASVEAQAHKELSREQRNWYLATRRATFAGDAHSMMQEYPSLPSEAFNQSQEGCYFAKQMLELRKLNRITSVPWQPGYPVHTAWDIGKRDGTAIWLFQKIGIDFRFIDFIEDWDKEYDHYVSQLQERGYVFGQHRLPHDAKQKRQRMNSDAPKDAVEILQALGLSNITVVPQTPMKILSINAARSLLANCYFDEHKCAAGIVHLESYHKQWSTGLATWLDVPEHDHHSEAADAFQQVPGFVELAKVDSKDWLRNQKSTNPFIRR